LWKRHRKILNPAFSTYKLNKFMPIVNEKARKLTDVLSVYQGQKEFNIIRLLSALTLENLLLSSFGLEKDFINNPYDNFFAIVKKFVTYFFKHTNFCDNSFFYSFRREASNIGNNIGSSIYLFLPKIHRKNEFSKFCQDILTEAESHNENSTQIENLNFIETLLANKTLLSADEIQDEVSTLILSVSSSVALQLNSQLFF